MYQVYLCVNKTKQNKKSFNWLIKTKYVKICANLFHEFVCWLKDNYCIYKIIIQVYLCQNETKNAEKNAFNWLI